MGTQASTASGGDVLRGRPASLPGLARPGAFLVDGPRRDLLSRVLVPAALSQSFLDVLVLTFALVAPRLLGHVGLLDVGIPSSRYPIRSEGNRANRRVSSALAPLPISPDGPGPVARHDAMTRSRRVRGQAGFATTSATLALAGVLVVVVCGLAWFALHPPHASQAPKLVLPDDAGRTRARTQAARRIRHVPASVQDSNARMRLRYAWLAATDWARDHHQSFSGLSPGHRAAAAAAQRRRGDPARRGPAGPHEVRHGVAERRGAW